MLLNAIGRRSPRNKPLPPKGKRDGFAYGDRGDGARKDREMKKDDSAIGKRERRRSRWRRKKKKKKVRTERTLGKRSLKGEDVTAGYEEVSTSERGTAFENKNKKRVSEGKILVNIYIKGQIYRVWGFGG